MARLSEHGIRLSSMSPSFLNSNSTSHTWPFSAVAELIDNASDPGVSARQIWVDVLEEGEQLCLTFTDNGSGMTPNKLHKMLSFGFTDKGSGKASQQAIGLYGNGFKSGSMRLGRDALVLTKNGGSQSVGMLSQSYLLSIRAQAVIVPIAPFIQHTKSLVVTEDSEASLAAILQHSPISSVEQLHVHFDSIASKKGTKILIWNIRRGKDGKPELDFESDVHDIRLPEVHIDEMKKGLRNTGSQRLEQNLPEMDFSLRAYLSILYLKPRLHIILRGQKVLATLVSKRLTHIKHDVYKPHLSKEKLKVTFGMNPKNKEHFGIMMYHKNRLIKSYEKVGCQIKSSGQRAGVGVIGVIECNFLKPAHNKQDFEYTKEYRLTLGALGLKLNDYWKDMMEKKPKEREFRALNRLDEKKSQDVNKGPMWLQCEECLKWRSLPVQHYKDPPDNWNCSQNPNPRFRRCSVSEEEDCDEISSPTYHKTHKKQNKSKCRKREISLEVCSLQDQREKHQALSRCVSEPSPCTIQHHDDTAGRTHPQHAADPTQSHGETHTHVLPDDETHTGDGTHTQVPRAEEEVPRDEEEVPRAEEEVPRAEEDVPRAEEEVPRAEEDVPRKVSRTDENVARTENTEQNGRGADTGKEHQTHNRQDKPTEKEDTMQAQEATHNKSIQSGPSTVERLSLKRNIEWPHGSLKKRLCLWKDQQPSPEDMAHAMHPGKEANKAQMMSGPDNPSLGRNPTSLSTQTVKVSPLSRTEGGQSRSYSREGVDRESLLQRLSGLEKETQKIQKLLGLELKRTTQGTMTTECVSAQKPSVEMETQTAAVETSVSTCQTENEALDQDRAKKDKNETPSIHVDPSAAAQEDLRVLRKNVVALLSVLLPQLDLTGISVDTPDVDTIMQQIIHVNSLTS